MGESSYRGASEDKSYKTIGNIKSLFKVSSLIFLVTERSEDTGLVYLLSVLIKLNKIKICLT